MQKFVNLVDLVKGFPTNIYLQNLASIQKRTSPVKFAHLAEKSGKGSISNLSTKDRTVARISAEIRDLAGHDEDAGAVGGEGHAADPTLVERFDIEPFPDFSAK